jgi:hypothetical protein
VTIARPKRTTLWHLTWNHPSEPAANERVSCVVYHRANGMELRIE